MSILLRCSRSVSVMQKINTFVFFRLLHIKEIILLDTQIALGSPSGTESEYISSKQCNFSINIIYCLIC